MRIDGREPTVRSPDAIQMDLGSWRPYPAVVHPATEGDRAEKALPSTFRLLGCRVDVDRNAVGLPSGERLLEPKVMQVLCALAARQGSVLTRDELIAAVWTRSFGADESLTRAASMTSSTRTIRDR